MKTIRIMLVLLGLHVYNVVYGASPEFYGVYANNIEIDNKTTYEFSPNIQFLVFQKEASEHAKMLTIKRMIFVRTVYDPGMGGKEPPKNKARWEPRKGGDIEMRIKPVTGHPDQVYVVPKSPLPAGRYTIGTRFNEIGEFLVNKKYLETNWLKEDCIDIYVGKGWASYEYNLSGGGKAVPCSDSPPTTSGSNASPSTDTGIGTSTSGKVSGTQQYKDNGNGTVTDNDKKLIWQQGGSDMLEWEPAIDYCKGLSLAGSNDWRLPTRNELGSILQQNKTYFLTTSCPSCPGYWTSTTDAKDTSLAWRVKLDRGDASSSKKTFKGYARCVRGGADVNAKENTGTSSGTSDPRDSQNTKGVVTANGILESVERRQKVFPAAPDYLYETSSFTGAVSSTWMEMTSGMLGTKGLRDKYEEFYLSAVDYRNLSQVQLIRAKRYAEKGDAETASHFLKSADHYLELFNLSRQGAEQAYLGNIDAAAELARGIYEGSKKAASFGGDALGPAGSRVVDVVFTATDFAVQASDVGVSQALKETIVDILTEAVLKSVPDSSLGGKTLSETITKKTTKAIGSSQVYGILKAASGSAKFSKAFTTLLAKSTASELNSLTKDQVAKIVLGLGEENPQVVAQNKP